MEGMLWITQAAFQEEGTYMGHRLTGKNPLIVGRGGGGDPCYILPRATFVLNPCLSCLVPTA